MADACNHYGNEGIMLTIVVTLADGSLLILLVAHLLMTESKDAWNIVWKKFFEWYPSFNSPETTFVSDGQKGLLETIASNFPEGLQFLCRRHRAENQGMPRSDRQLYKLAAAAQLEDKMTRLLDRMTPAGRDEVHSKPLAQQMKAMHAQLESKPFLASRDTQNPAESTMNILRIVGARTQVIK